MAVAALTEQHAITDALGQGRDGVPGALDRLIPLVYGNLAGGAHRPLARDGSGHVPATTARIVRRLGRRAQLAISTVR